MLPLIKRLCLCFTLFVLPIARADLDEIPRAARIQIGRTIGYDPSYRSLAYPNGDVPIQSGVCTDVVIRALRSSLQIDLQKQIHEDMTRNFSSYPQNWGLSRPDKNIDHRRVPNLQTFFKRQGYELPISEDLADYLPGDIVTCLVGGKLPHIMIVGDQKTSTGRPLVIHNIGSGTQEEDRLFSFPLTGLYRIRSPSPSSQETTSSSSQYIQYTVGSKNDGGTLSGVSKLHYGTPTKWKSIYEANKDIIQNPDIIHKGLKLRIPNL